MGDTSSTGSADDAAAAPEPPAAGDAATGDPATVERATADAATVAAPAAGGSWKLGRRATTCVGCDASFAPGAAVTSALHTGEGGFARRDWCETCFETASATAFSWWTATLPLETDKKPTFDLSVAREFLVRLLAEGGEEREALRYLLVLLLMRKRIVRLHEQIDRDGVDVMIVTIPPSDEPHEISCPPIDEAEAESLRAELGRLFDL